VFSSFTLAPHIRKISYLFCIPTTKVGGLMPEFSSEMAGVVTGETIPRAIPGAIVETE
jgi:hypothetical protein